MRRGCKNFLFLLNAPVVHSLAILFDFHVISLSISKFVYLLLSSQKKYHRRLQESQAFCSYTLESSIRSVLRLDINSLHHNHPSLASVASASASALHAEQIVFALELHVPIEPLSARFV